MSSLWRLDGLLQLLLLQLLPKSVAFASHLLLLPFSVVVTFVLVVFVVVMGSLEFWHTRHRAFALHHDLSAPDAHVCSCTWAIFIGTDVTASVL